MLPDQADSRVWDATSIPDSIRAISYLAKGGVLPVDKINAHRALSRRERGRRGYQTGSKCGGISVSIKEKIPESENQFRESGR
jgi:hypothetical protein